MCAHCVENRGDACVSAPSCNAVSELAEDRERQDLGADVGVVVRGRDVGELEHVMAHAVLEKLQADVHMPIAPARLLGQDRDGCLVVNEDWNLGGRGVSNPLARRRAHLLRNAGNEDGAFAGRNSCICFCLCSRQSDERRFRCTPPYSSAGLLDNRRLAAAAVVDVGGPE